MLPDLHTRGVEVDELLAVAVLVIVEGGRDGSGVGRRRPAARLAQQSAADPHSPDYCACSATRQSFQKSESDTVASSDMQRISFNVNLCRVVKLDFTPENDAFGRFHGKYE